MLSKKRRISKKEIEVILKTGKRLNSPHLSLYISKTNLGCSRFSFSVSKKVCPKAVDRNKYRRRGYSVIQKINQIKPGYDCLFVFKKGSSGIKHDIVEGEISELLYVSGVLI